MTLAEHVAKVADEWPACVNCGAPVDERHDVPVHYWTEESSCLAWRDGRIVHTGSVAAI